MRLLVLFGVALALGACGGSDDEADVARVAESYYTALAERDWKGVCATRAPAERDELARGGRSCERTFQAMLEGRPGADRFFAEVEIGDVRVTGDRARADVVHPRQQAPITGLTAVRENRRWFLKDLLGLEPR